MADDTTNNAGNFDILRPQKDPLYVSFGYFEDMMSIIKSQIFFPTFITGLSGNGKTLMVEQVCARSDRELVRLNITAETDEDDLLGGFRLISENGASKTKFEYGPVPIAMIRGSVLLLDEVDLGSAKLMALQPVLEGKPVYLKKINKIVHPSPGFNIIACANTKGRGDLEGKFIGTNLLNEAFLERFSITVEQEYPTIDVERKILKKLLTFLIPDASKEDEEFVECLLQWAETIRKSYYEQTVSDIISTRRLCNTLRAYHIFGRNRVKVVKYAINRFDEETKKNFMDTYIMIDQQVTRENSNRNASSPIQAPPSRTGVPF